jgi:hypothetical protein
LNGWKVIDHRVELLGICPHCGGGAGSENAEV